MQRHRIAVTDRRRDRLRRTRNGQRPVLFAFMIGGIQAGLVAAALSDSYPSLVYGAVVVVSVSIHALLRRRFEG